jgi:hypothetical protein
MRIASLLLGSLVVQSCSSKAPGPDQAISHYRLFVLSELRGELEPCGCTLEPLGGLARLASYLKARKEPGVEPVLVAHGDLVSPGKVSSGSAPQIQQAGEFLQRKLIEMGLVISGNGHADAQLESSFQGLRTVNAMPWLEVNELKRVKGIQFLRGAPAAAVDPLRPAVLLFDGDLEQAKAKTSDWLRLGIDLIILSETDESPAIVQLSEGLFALTGGERGQQVLEVDLHWQGGALARLEGAGERAAALKAMQSRIDGLIKQRDRAKVRQKPKALLAARTAQVQRAKVDRSELLASPLPKPPAKGSTLSGQRVPLDSNITEDASMNSAIQAHHRAISALNKKLEKNRECKAPVGADQPQYIGSAACQGCHAQAYALWKTTPHAKAWATLEHKGRTYDYTCVGCHSAGFDEPGGFCRISEAADRVNVGCESCHGPGSLHAASGNKALIKREVPVEGCTNCHHPPHTNTFIYEDRLKRVLGPGHEAKK